MMKRCPHDTLSAHTIVDAGGYRLVSWNVAARTGRMDERIHAIGRLRPDILVLQEVTASNLPAFHRDLPALGLDHILDSRTLAPDARALSGPRRYGELLSSRWPMEALLPDEFEVPWPERILSAVVQSPFGEVEVHVAHLPTGVAHGWIKIETFEGIFARLARRSTTPRILCGDFNSPQAEAPGGEIITWGQEQESDGHGTPPPPGNDPWDPGERSVLEGLATYDLGDVFRRLHPRAEEFSWVWRGRGKGGARKTVHRRFDHIFASESLCAVVCHYAHSVREAGLSDHSAMIVEFRPRLATDGI
jgi:exonuclease III